MTPARSSAQYFQTSLPEPSALPRHEPRSIGPAGMKIAGKFIEIAPMSSAGVVLSQPPIKHRAVGRIGAQRLLGLHRQEVAIHHRRRLLKRLGQRHRRQFNRKAARLPYAALHLLDPLLEMGVAGIDVAPGVDDRDHRLPGIIGAIIAHLRGARTMAEGAQIVRPRTSDDCEGLPDADAPWRIILSGNCCGSSTSGSAG